MKNKTKKINPVRNKTPWASVYAFAHRISNGIKILQKISAAGALLFLVFLFFVNTASAAPDPTIYYQGKLTDTSDVAVVDNPYNFKFRIYDAATNGNCLWSARGDCTTPTAKSVSVSKGIFSTELGDAGDNALDLDFNSNYWLEVTVGNDSPMDTRKKINAAGYALNSTRLDGGTWEVPGTIGADTPNSAAFTTLDSSEAINLATGAGSVVTIGNSTGAATLASGGASSWVNTSGDLTISTVTSGTLALTSASALNLSGTSLVVDTSATSDTINIEQGTYDSILSFTQPGAATQTYTFATGGTVATSANNLSIFAATTSAQLSGVLTDENTSGGYMTDVMTTAGDLIYAGASGVPARLGEGTNDAYVLKINTTTHVPYWSADLQGISHTQNTDTGTDGTAFTVGDGSTTLTIDTAAANDTINVEQGTYDSLLTFTQNGAAQQTYTFTTGGTVCTTGSVCSGYQASGSYLTAEADTLATVTSRGSITNGQTITIGPAATYDPIILSAIARGATSYTGTITSADLTSTNRTWAFPDLDGTVALAAQLHNALTISDTSTVNLSLATQLLSADIVDNSIGDTQLAYDTGQNLTSGSTPTFEDTAITGLSGSIISSTSIETSIEELDEAVYKMGDTGFDAWTSGTDANSYTITGGTFQLDRSGAGFIKGKKVTWSSGQQTGVLAANDTYWIYIDSAGLIQSSTTYPSNNIILFEVLYDGTNYDVVKENHSYAFDSGASGYLHNNAGTVIRGNGAIITRVATGNGGANGDREIKIVGADYVDDHGLSASVPDSAGAGVSWQTYYVNGSGDWILYASQTQMPMYYNSSGTATTLTSGGGTDYNVYTLYVSKNDIESSNPTYIAVMGNGYASASAAQTAINDGTVNFMSNELERLEMAQLGYAIVQNNGSGGYVYSLTVAKSTFNRQLVGGSSGADHGTLTGLSDDDHTQYALLAGRAGGQTLIGGTGAGDDLTFQTTADGTKGSYIFSELGSGLVLSTSGTLSAVTNTLHTQNTDTGTTGVSFVIGSATDAAANDLTLQFGSSNQETFYFDGNGTDNFLLSDDLNITGGLTVTTDLVSNTQVKILENGGTPTLYGIFDVGDLTSADKTYTFPDVSGYVALNPMTTTGDIIYASNTATPATMARLAGAAGFLKSTGAAAPAWSSVTATDVGLGSVTNNAQLITGNSNQLGYFNDIYLDDTNASNHLIINYGSDVASDFTLGLLMTASYNLTIAGTASITGTNTGDQFTSETISTLIGRGSAAGAGAAQEITLGTNLSMSGTTLNATGGSGPFTDGSDITYLTDLTNEDFAIGNSAYADAIFGVDVDNNTVRIGSSVTTNGILNMYASDDDTGSITYNTSDTWAFSGGNINLADDMLLTLGTTGDLAMLNRSTTLTANTALTGVFVGTPVVRAIDVANTTIFSNITTDADIIFAVSDGGNSTELLRLDASASTVDIGTGATALTVDTNGNVGIGTITPGQKLSVAGTFGIRETGTTPTYYTIFQGGDQTGADITYTLPASSANGVLTNTSGTLSWGAGGSQTPWAQNVDAANYILSNIGNAGTDFVATTGALTLAGVLTANGGVSMGTQTLSGTTGIINYTGFDVDASGNLDTLGTLTAGSGNVQVTDAAGKVQHDSIVDCADGQILKWATAGGWACAADATGGGGSTIIEKDSNETIASDATMTNDGALVFTASASTAYYVQVRAAWTSNTTAEFKYTMTIPSGTIRASGRTFDSLGLTNISGENCNLNASGDVCTIAGTVTNDGILEINAIVAVNGTGGTVAFQWAQNVLTATNTTVFKNSFLEYRALAGTADLAEVYYTNEPDIGSGDIVSIDPDLAKGVKKSEGSYDRNIFGIVSTDPALLIGDAGEGGVPVPIALSGRVPVKITTENGPIEIGDLLTSSSTPGVAMKATKAGQIVGQAMESFDGEGVGLVLAFVKTDYANGSTLADIISESSDVDISDADIGKTALIKFISQKEQVAQQSDFSEIITDRVAAGLEIITPKVTAETAAVDKIEAATGLDIAVNLAEGGVLKISNSLGGENGIVFDDAGNATFQGTLTADTIVANRILGLEVYTNQLLNIDESVANLSTKLSGLETASEEAPDISVLGIWGKNDGLVIAKEGTFKEETVFEKLVTLIGNVVFQGEISFEKVPTFSQDTAGYAIIKENADRVEVAFNQEYATTPVVNASLSLQYIEDDEVREAAGELLLVANANFIITNVTTKGFEIRINKKTISDIPFSWQALAVKDARTFESKSVSSSKDKGNENDNRENISQPIEAVPPIQENDSSMAPVLREEIPANENIVINSNEAVSSAAVSSTEADSLAGSAIN